MTCKSFVHGCFSSRVALTDAVPKLLRVALNRPVDPELLRIALTAGVLAKNLGVALTEVYLKHTYVVICLTFYQRYI